MKTYTTGQGIELLVDDEVYEVIKNKHFTWMPEQANAVNRPYNPVDKTQGCVYLTTLVKEVMNLPGNVYRQRGLKPYDFTASNFSRKKPRDGLKTKGKSKIEKVCPPSTDPRYKHIPLGHGLYTIVDAADYEDLNRFNWCTDKDRYAQHGTLGKMHRYLLGLTDPNQHVDHINGIPFDNRRENLRLADYSGNMQNRKKYKRNGKEASSPYKGVVKVKNGKFTAFITANGVKHYLGIFEDEIEAALAYDKQAVVLHKEFAVLNFPDLLE